MLVNTKLTYHNIFFLMFTVKTTGWVLTKEDNKTLHSISELPFFSLTFVQAKPSIFPSRCHIIESNSRTPHFWQVKLVLEIQKTQDFLRMLLSKESSLFCSEAPDRIKQSNIYIHFCTPELSMLYISDARCRETMPHPQLSTTSRSSIDLFQNSVEFTVFTSVTVWKIHYSDSPKHMFNSTEVL